MSTRWHVQLLEGLPPDSRRRLSKQLRRSVRAGSPPTQRAWAQTVQQEVNGRYRRCA